MGHTHTGARAHTNKTAANNHSWAASLSFSKFSIYYYSFTISPHPPFNAFGFSTLNVLWTHRIRFPIVWIERWFTKNGISFDNGLIDMPQPFEICMHFSRTQYSNLILNFMNISINIKRKVPAQIRDRLRSKIDPSFSTLYVCDICWTKFKLNNLVLCLCGRGC